jgi:hypothetical protein
MAAIFSDFPLDQPAGIPDQRARIVLVLAHIGGTDQQLDARRIDLRCIQQVLKSDNADPGIFGSDDARSLTPIRSSMVWPVHRDAVFECHPAIFKMGIVNNRTAVPNAVRIIVRMDSNARTFMVGECPP